MGFWFVVTASLMAFSVGLGKKREDQQVVARPSCLLHEALALFQIL
jgi:hypothetical protein